MNTLVIYYTYSGHSEKIARQIAEKEQAELYQIKELHRRSKLGVYFNGARAAMSRKCEKIQAITVDFSSFDKIIIVMPIWAGTPAPAMNNVIDLLPAGKNIELIMASGGGNSQKSAQKTKDLITAKGSTVTKYEDIKTA